jgi:predicted phage tail protein
MSGKKWPKTKTIGWLLVLLAVAVMLLRNFTADTFYAAVFGSLVSMLMLFAGLIMINL